MPDICYHCNKHLATTHNSDESSCTNCLMSTITKLRRCSKCTLATYCGGECQKAHWREHKAECKILATEREKAMSLGLGERYESLEKWRRHRANSLLGPASWVLDVGLDTDKSGTHIFLVKLVITEASENRRNPWRLESARIVPHHLLSQTYGYDIEPQTDIVRILFVDEALSRHFLLHWEIRVDAEAEGKLRRLVLKEDECDWIDWTSNLVQYGVHRPDRPPEIDSYLYPKGITRQESMKRFLRFHMWVDEVWEVLLGAADSALELQTSPERLETHRLVVFADLLVKNNDTPSFAIRDAKPMSTADIQRQIYCLEAGSYVQSVMQKHLFADGHTRVLLIADGLSFPFNITSSPLSQCEPQSTQGDSVVRASSYDANWLDTLKSRTARND